MEKISILLLIIAFFTTPFYFFSSGSLQPSHIFYLLFSGMVFIEHYKKGLDKNSVKLFFPFYLYIILVNTIYSLIYQDMVFFNYPIAMTFNLIIYFGIILFLSNSKFSNYLLQRITSIVLILFLFIIALWSIGLGEYKFHPRYNGFFNDPNQMAFFILCCSAIACLFSKSFYQYLAILICSMFLVILTISRSGLMGISCLIISFFLYFWKGNHNSLLYVIGVLFVFFILIFLNLEFLVNSYFVQPYVERASNMSLDEQADIRGYTRIVDYSEYLLFGAGQGLDNRFGIDLEIHSTWAAFLFYYGFFGFLLFIYLIISILVRLDIKQKLLFLAPLMYSFSTFGARTVIFWIFIAFFFYTAYFLNKPRVH